ncbi:methyltransferase domain-containing protein [Scytonema sp. UIC 10036]|uniref:SAM-dependent methyltransferase n=1 Tax=Scytonema sp. UIC 10036 TaxID=2304196 RepID=UPI0012DA0AF7|nr:methyltransferase domain-containing protein [Scytonema sp. UIC 10036]MUG91836.1 methyltransferase domain-containing protein [Scytonema sp. UIC 10036]
MSNYTPEKVAQMYDALEDQGETAVLIDQYHLGYWDETNANGSLTEAADRLTEVMIGKVSIQPGERFCDLGCGVGAPAIQLAKATGCFIDGITISESQYEKAQQLAAKAGLSEQVHFILGDALNMPCEDATYDGGWFFESIFHMGHRKALQEASRILKPGAILVIADVPARPTMTEEFKKLCEEQSHSFVIPKEDYPEVLDAAGFDLIEIEDVTDFVMTPLVPKMRLACQQYESEFLQYVQSPQMQDWLRSYQNRRGMEYIESEAIEYWIQMLQEMCDNLGYALVTAQKRA